MGRVEKGIQPPLAPGTKGTGSRTKRCDGSGAGHGLQEEYAITVAPDCHGTQYENSNRSWFYFGVSLAESAEVASSQALLGAAPALRNSDAQDRVGQAIGGSAPWNARTRRAGDCPSGDGDDGVEDKSTSAEGGSRDDASDDERGGTPGPSAQEAGEALPVQQSPPMLDGKMTISLAVCNMNNQTKLYRHGYRPWFRTLPHMPRWQRLPNATFSYDWGGDPADGGSGFVLRWQYPLQPDGSTTFFAFCVPFGYECCQDLLGVLERDLAVNPGHEPEVRVAAGCVSECTMRCLSGTVQEDWLPRPGTGIYFHRQELGRSLEGRAVEMLTITAAAGMAGEALEVDRSPPELQLRGHPPVLFPGRPLVFFSARVHPGETPGQFAFIGSLRFLLSDDPRAVALRDNFVFKLVPMLNPDGVARGHYRTNSIGLNLNRFYHEALPEEHEGVWAAKQMLVHWSREARLLLYVDFHAHASKVGCFFLANRLKGPGQAWNMGYARLCQINSPHFDLSACDFADLGAAEDKGKDGLGKEGAGRVAIHRDCHMCHSYTLECNYHMGKSFNSAYAAPTSLPAWASCPGIQSAAQAFPHEYNCSSWSQVGEALCVSLLDLYGHNCYSRLPHTRHGSVSKLLSSTAVFRGRRGPPSPSEVLPQVPGFGLNVDKLHEREHACERHTCAWGSSSSSTASAGPRAQSASAGQGPPRSRVYLPLPSGGSTGAAPSARSIDGPYRARHSEVVKPSPRQRGSDLAENRCGATGRGRSGSARASSATPTRASKQDARSRPPCAYDHVSAGRAASSCAVMGGAGDSRSSVPVVRHSSSLRGRRAGTTGTLVEVLPAEPIGLRSPGGRGRGTGGPRRREALGRGAKAEA